MIEIIEKIFSKLKEISYSIFSDEGTTYEEAKEYAEETISDAIRNFTNYACCVLHMQRMIRIWVMTSHYEGQEFRDKVEALDRKRRIAHDAAIANLSMLNRICDTLNIEKFEINLKDRYAVGNWIGMFCAELYQLSDQFSDCCSTDDHMGKISRLFSKANAQNGYDSAEKASDAVEKIDQIYLNKCLGNIGLENPVTDDEMIQAVADLDAIAEKYLGEPFCRSSDIGTVKKFVFKFFNEAYKNR